MLSSPPPTITSVSPSMTRCAAMAIACRPELQKRLTVTPETVTGRPARTAERRAMFWPVARSGMAQPRITSSTSPGSNAGARDRLLDHVAAEHGAVGGVERAAIGLTDRRAGGGNNDGLGHTDLL